MLRSILIKLTFLMSAFILISDINKAEAQTLIPDEISLERAVYSNRQKGLDNFSGITEKHTFTLERKIDMSSVVSALKKDSRVIAAEHDTKLNTLTVLIKKTSLHESRSWLQPVIEENRQKVQTHDVKFYKAD